MSRRQETAQQETAKGAYHHGDLRRGMVDAAIALVEQDGIAALSLRKLAERLGVSQTALYHHFRDKQALLCAIGEAAIELLSGQMQQGLVEVQGLELRFERFVSLYVRFALEHPEMYELLFGRTLWKAEGAESEAFRSQARASFRGFAQGVGDMQARGLVSLDLDPLRLAQVMWGTLHGLCSMYNDGLAFSAGDVEDISQYARRMMQRLHTGKG